MQTLLNSNLLGSAIALLVSIPTPLILFKDNPKAVLTGLAGGIVAGSVVTTLVSDRHGKKVQPKKQAKVSPKPQVVVKPKTSTVNSSKPSVTQKGNQFWVKGDVPRSVIINHNTGITWLKDRDIQVIRSHQVTEADRVFNRIAWYRGKHGYCQELVKLHDKLRKKEGKIYFDFKKGTEGKVISLCTGYATLLKNSGMLTDYHYNSKNKVMRLEVSDRQNIKQFLNGGWFERCVYQVMVKKLSKGGTIDCLINPVVRFPDGDVYELDLLFMVNNQPLWIECKSGNHWNECLPKYCQRREVLNINKKQSLLLGLELNQESANSMTAIHDITVINTEQLLSKVEDVLNL